MYRFQELDLSPEALITKDSSREEMWVDLVESSLKYAGNYKRVNFIKATPILIHIFLYFVDIHYSFGWYFITCLCF